MITYRIGRTQPSQTIPSGHLLLTEGLSPAIPTFRKMVRRGQSRRREERLLQVLPGFMFLPAHEAARASAYLSQMGRRLTWMMNPTLPGTYATCTTDELRPLFEWADTDPDRKKEEDLLLSFHIGQTVRVKDGVFVGLQGQIASGPLLRGDHPQVKILLDLYGRSTPVIIPLALIEAV